jgi:electron transfer flavoprotein alpha subunit
MVNMTQRMKRLSKYADSDLTEEECRLKKKYLGGNYTQHTTNTTPPQKKTMWQKVFPSRQEKIRKLREQLEMEKLHAEIRVQKTRAQKKGRKSGWNPDLKHLQVIG